MLNFNTPKRSYSCFDFCMLLVKFLAFWTSQRWLTVYSAHLSSHCLTGALGSEEAFPPVAGAALHPGTDDPGHVHPNVTFTGQLSQHKAVHVPMRHGQRDKTRTPTAATYPALPVAVIMFHHITGAAWEQCPKPQEVHFTETLRRKWMRTGRKDTADFVKLEVRGSIDACDQAQFGCRWLWMWIYCTVLYFCIVFFCLALLDRTASDAMAADSWLRSDWCTD